MIRIYKDKFDRIKNSLPEEFFDDINVTLNKIQDVLNVVTEKINASRPWTN